MLTPVQLYYCVKTDFFNQNYSVIGYRINVLVEVLFSRAEGREAIGGNRRQAVINNKAAIAYALLPQEQRQFEINRAG